MQQYARIENGLVAELFSTAADIGTLFHPALHWVALSGQTVTVGDLYANGAFSAPPPPEPAPAAPGIAELQAQLAELARRIAALPQS